MDSDDRNQRIDQTRKTSISSTTSSIATMSVSSRHSGHRGRNNSITSNSTDYSSDDSDDDAFALNDTHPLPVLTSGHSVDGSQRCGYLFKQGGLKANKGWKRRWVVFDGSTLRYYNTDTSHVSNKIIYVSQMNSVEHVESDKRDLKGDGKGDNKREFKFKITTTLRNRVFVFATDDHDQSTLWTNTIMLAIIKHQKAKKDSTHQAGEEQQEEKSTGKQGFIKFANLKKYYVTLKGQYLQYFKSFVEFQMGSPINEIDMKLASVKAADGKRNRLEVWTPYGHFNLGFENEWDMQSWRMAMEDAIAQALADDTVLETVYGNTSNRECADCGAENPHWASINLCIALCKNCAGIHRMFDHRVSKIRSLRMDTRIWTPELIELMIDVGNANSNAFWEANLNEGVKPSPACSVEERITFIHSKYLHKKYCYHHPRYGMHKKLGDELHHLADTDDVLGAMRAIFSGADVVYRKDACEKTAYAIAKERGHKLVMELLDNTSGNPHSVSGMEEDEKKLRGEIRMQGYLNKTGPSGRTYEKRWCVLENGALTYYLNENSGTYRGYIDQWNIMVIQEVNLDKPGYYFEVSTKNVNKKDNRIYSFSSDRKDVMEEWKKSIAKLIAPLPVMAYMDIFDIKFAGHADVKFVGNTNIEDVGTVWTHSFLMLTEGALRYMTHDGKMDYIDLRNVIDIMLLKFDETGQQAGAKKAPCCFVYSINRSMYFQANLSRDTERLYSELLRDSNDINVPL